MAHETRRPSRLPVPPCGHAIYRATPDDPGVLVNISFDDGRQTAEVLEGEDAGEIVLLRAMGGSFEPVRQSAA